MIEVDFLIVGQGIAGTNLAFHLLQNQFSFHVFDQPAQPPNASSVAAGIINPITGRKFVKSWMIETLLPQAITSYQAMEVLLKIPLLTPIPVLRTLATQGEFSDWEGRLSESSYQPFMAENPTIGNIPSFLQPPIGYGQVLQSARVDTALLINQFQTYLRHQHKFTSHKFQYDQVQMHTDCITYQNYKCQHLIFAEGAGIQYNPFFPPDLIRPNKGQVLIIHTPSPKETMECIVKQSLFFVPIQSQTYWIGSTTENNFNTPEPTSEGRNQLLGKLHKVFLPEFTVTNHWSGLRATVKDRRPAMGTHPDFPRIHLFNGMGTKGASLAPYWSQQLINHIVNNQPLDPHVNYHRFL
jgi:glycine/D-amino acid oxidase-like deaminating enzyme